MYTEILILGFLRRGAQHGYAIKQSMEQVLGGSRVTNSQLYPALKHFEEMGAVTAEVIRQTGKPDRHLYQLLPLGEEILHDLIVDIASTPMTSDREFYVRVGHFDLLTPTERLVILEARKGALARRKERIATWSSAAWATRVAHLRTHLLDQEITVLQEWIRESEDQKGGTTDEPCI